MLQRAVEKIRDVSSWLATVFEAIGLVQGQGLCLPTWNRELTTVESLRTTSLSLVVFLVSCFSLCFTLERVSWKTCEGQTVP